MSFYARSAIHFFYMENTEKTLLNSPSTIQQRETQNKRVKNATLVYFFCRVSRCTTCLEKKTSPLSSVQVDGRQDALRTLTIGKKISPLTLGDAFFSSIQKAFQFKTFHTVYAESRLEPNPFSVSPFKNSTSFCVCVCVCVFEYLSKMD